LIYVLHAFQKKSKKDVATPKQTIELVKSRLRGRQRGLPGTQGRGTQAMTTRRRKVEVGSGDIFADLGLPDAANMLLKSTIAIELHRLIKQRTLTQSAAAKLIGISQGDLSKVHRGQFRGYSEAKLMRMLTAFDQDVEITTRPHR
jgi:predicted XRE-type DNA-binding protein